LSISFSKHVLFDYVYLQNPDGLYIFDSKTGDFQLRDKNNVIDSILNILSKIYTNIITHYKIKHVKPDCNIVLLDQALDKYSRDIYGKKRLHARIEHCSQLTTMPKTALLRFSDYGLKIDSTSPYIHREISVLLYWLSVLKPFSIEPSGDTIKALGLSGKFHNEYISYVFAQAALQPFNMKLVVHKNDVFFSEFLYDLHYRNLSRSSLELFLDLYIKPF
jgi:hypothetical protein